MCDPVLVPVLVRVAPLVRWTTRVRARGGGGGGGGVTVRSIEIDITRRLRSSAIQKVRDTSCSIVKRSAAAAWGSFSAPQTHFNSATLSRVEGVEVDAAWGCRRRTIE